MVIGVFINDFRILGLKNKKMCTELAHSSDLELQALDPPQAEILSVGIVKKDRLCGGVKGGKGEFLLRK